MEASRMTDVVVMSQRETDMSCGTYLVLNLYQQLQETHLLHKYMWCEELIRASAMHWQSCFPPAMYFSIGNPVDLAHDPAECHPRLWVVVDETV